MELWVVVSVSGCGAEGVVLCLWMKVLVHRRVFYWEPCLSGGVWVAWRHVPVCISVVVWWMYSTCVFMYKDRNVCFSAFSLAWRRQWVIPPLVCMLATWYIYIYEKNIQKHAIQTNHLTRDNTKPQVMEVGGNLTRNKWLTWWWHVDGNTESRWSDNKLYTRKRKRQWERAKNRYKSENLQTGNFNIGKKTKSTLTDLCIRKLPNNVKNRGRRNNDRKWRDSTWLVQSKRMGNNRN